MRPREEGHGGAQTAGAASECCLGEEERTTEVTTKAACASKGQGPPFSKLQGSPASKT